MKALSSLALVVALAALAFFLGRVEPLRVVLGVIIPYVAIAIFLAGVSYKVIVWSLSPVPFRIPTSCGQQKSLSWIKAGWLENPHSTPGVVARMALEVLLFRSLFRNTKAELREGPRLIYGERRFLWLGALAFHWSFLVIFVRHLRFFIEPVPRLVMVLDRLDSFFQVGIPLLYITDVTIVAALLYLLLRRLRDPQVRYISLFADYFALFLILGLALSGVWMRYFARIDVVAVKQLAIGLVTFSPIVPREVTSLFLVHLILLSTLLAYFPFSKLMHMGGIFLSPTRNLANNNRRKRHVNPWDYPVPVHPYQEWEAEFHDKIAAAGLPLEK
ncbi:MAG: sulfate reduction electron transfer complex DsrMKJOP subunit DsrM [Acidobacteriia bacterium]|nr:sulfate reduction electron transfer complex DsrMKJOP subunit DsrM [Terriglobia bacterium]